MLGLLLALLLASCSSLTGFKVQTTRFRCSIPAIRSSTPDEVPTSSKTPMTITEKEKDFQNTLDNLLVEARANNALTSGADGAFSEEQIKLAAEEMKKLNLSNNGSAAVALQNQEKLEARLKSFEDDAPNNEASAGGGVFKKIAIFGALTLVFAAVLLPIIDKIFPDPPSIETSISGK